MVTEVPGILLCVWTADCVPLFLYDTERSVIAIAHCGWRSICNGVVSNTVKVMVRRFRTRPESVVAAFGPGICRECYEVGDELIEAFSRRFPLHEIGGLFTPRKGGKCHLDLRKAISFELFRMAVDPEKVHDLGICSYESGGYSSYRRDGSSDLSELTLSGIVLAE